MRRKYLATTEPGHRVAVAIKPFSNGLDCAISLNGLDLLSIYEVEEAEDKAKYFVTRRYGAIVTWEKVGDEETP